MPLVDDDDNVIDPRVPWSLQSEADQVRTLELCSLHKLDLEEEYGKHRIEKLASGRVLLVPRDEDPFVCYLHDPKSDDPFLVVDDFTPELWEEWWPKDPLPAPIEARPLDSL